MKRVLSVVTLVLIVGASVGGLTYAAFIDKTRFEGSIIKVGTADLKLYDNLMLPPTPPNLVDQKASPNFVEITPTWSKDYLLKLYNSSPKPLALTSKSDYTTAEDPEDLRRYFMVEIFQWNDSNNSGTVDPTELGEPYGKKNVIDWKSEGFDLGEIGVNETKPLVLRFTAPEIPDAKQDKQGKFSFEFNAVGL